MSNVNEGRVDGSWLLIAIEAQGETQASAARQIGKRRDFFNEHIKGGIKLKSESLAMLARAFPTMNMRFVLTGQGDPITTP